MIGGEVVEEPYTIYGPGGGSSDIDVLGPNGEFVEVGGPAKAANLGGYGRQLGLLKQLADLEQTVALTYLTANTPQAAIDLATRILGAGNVFLF